MVATVWIGDDDALVALIDKMRHHPVYALDTEFHRERTYWPKLALVQLAWPGGDIALVDPFAVDLAPLASLLQSDALGVLHAADQDIEVLELSCGAVPQLLLDTQIAAGFLGFSSASLATLAERVLGRQLTKGDRLTDWTQRPLTDTQAQYAADDVAHLIDLYATLRERLEAVGRFDWAMEESAQLLHRTRRTQDPDRAWWRIKESRSLRGPARGVAASVAAWRERRAAELDRPVRTVLSDLAILGIAQRQPRTAEDLKGLRGFDPRSLRDGAVRELLAAVEEGRSVRPGTVEAPPVDDLDRRLRPAATLAAAWVGQLAQDIRIDPALLATRNDIHEFLRGAEGARLATGWRADLVGERLRLLVEGRAALSFRPGRGDLVLEERSERELTPDVPIPED